jgi:hypothetical protein
VAARDVDRAGQVRLLELVLLADVDEHGLTVAVAIAVAVVMQMLVDLLRVHLPDLLLDLADELRAGRHVRENS